MPGDNVEHASGADCRGREHRQVCGPRTAVCDGARDRESPGECKLCSSGDDGRRCATPSTRKTNIEDAGLHVDQAVVVKDDRRGRETRALPGQNRLSKSTRGKVVKRFRRVVTGLKCRVALKIKKAGVVENRAVIQHKASKVPPDHISLVVQRTLSEHEVEDRIHRDSSGTRESRRARAAHGSVLPGQRTGDDHITRAGERASERKWRSGRRREGSPRIERKGSTAIYEEQSTAAEGRVAVESRAAAAETKCGAGSDIDAARICERATAVDAECAGQYVQRPETAVDLQAGRSFAQNRVSSAAGFADDAVVCESLRRGIGGVDVGVSLETPRGAVCD